MSLEEAQTLVMNARVQLGWVDPADLAAAEEATETDEATEADAAAEADEAEGRVCTIVARRGALRPLSRSSSTVCAWSSSWHFIHLRGFMQVDCRVSGGQQVGGRGTVVKNFCGRFFNNLRTTQSVVAVAQRILAHQSGS